jgi:hypothetical protein
MSDTKSTRRTQATANFHETEVGRGVYDTLKGREWFLKHNEDFVDPTQ